MTKQIYCKHCGKLIDEDSLYCMYCGGALHPINSFTQQVNKQDFSFVRQLDILGGKALNGTIKGIINIIKWLGLVIKRFENSMKQCWKSIGLLIKRFVNSIEQCQKSIELTIKRFVNFIKQYWGRILIFIVGPVVSILLLYLYGTFVYAEHNGIYGKSTTFFDTVKREFYWITPNYTIPDYATSIGDSAFGGCRSLTSIVIPDGVTSIEKNAFTNCSSLTSVTIPDGVTSIGINAFTNCSSLTSIVIPDGVTSIGINAFTNCSSLTSIVIPDGVTSIEKNAFRNCSLLTSVTIPDSVTSIEDFAFEFCGSLTSVTIPDGVTLIGRWAFHECRSLKTIYCKATTPPILSPFPFYGVASECKIYVPIASVDKYKKSYAGVDYLPDIVGYHF